VHCASYVVKVCCLLGRSAPDSQKLVPLPTLHRNPRRHSKPSGTSGIWRERPCLWSLYLRVSVVVDVTKPLLQVISMYFVRFNCARNWWGMNWYQIWRTSILLLLQLAWCFHGLTYTDGTRPDWQMAMASFRGMLTVPSHLWTWKNQQPWGSTPAGWGAARIVCLGSQAFLGRGSLEGSHFTFELQRSFNPSRLPFCISWWQWGAL